MKQQSDTMKFHPAARQTIRREAKSLRIWRARLFLILCLGLLVANPAFSQTDGPANGLRETRALRLAEVQLVGATRTSLETVYHHLPLQPGQVIDQTKLIDAVAALRAQKLFESVAFYTKPGLKRGQLVLVLEVKEHSFDFRWAVGNTDIDGWYLVPAMLAYDNPFGKGRVCDFQWRVGFRSTGTVLRYAQPRAGDGSAFWSTKLQTIATDRPYYFEGVQYQHDVENSGFEAVYGRRLSSHRLGEIGFSFENVNVAHHSVANIQTEDGLTFEDQDIPEDELLPSIKAAVGHHQRAILHCDWQYDNRSKQLRAGTPVSGIWGRVRGHLALQSKYSHPGIKADFRLYREVPGGVFALRLQGSAVGNNSQFYDRLYLGGMYSLRGFPTNSLSSPGGDTWLLSSSLEYRSKILGDAKGTKLAGLFFLDAGKSGSPGGEETCDGLAVGAGYGLRLRVSWLGWIGLDVGFPLTDRPEGSRFNVDASIGWSF